MYLENQEELEKILSAGIKALFCSYIVSSL